MGLIPFAVASLIAALMSDGLQLVPPQDRLVPHPPEPPRPHPPGMTEDLAQADSDSWWQGMSTSSGMRAAWWLAKNKMNKKLALLVEGELMARAVASEAVEGVAKSKSTWRVFWRKVVQKLGLRGTAAAALIVADGPLPAGDLIALGLTAWMLYDIYVLIYDFWGVTASETQPDL